MNENKPYFFPTLYNETEVRKIMEWSISVQWIENIPTIVTVFGYGDGKKQTTMLKILYGKNIGRSNQTTPYEQALSEAKSKWEKKQLENYRQNVNDDKQLLPMLAHKYVDHKHKVVWPAYGQSKLNGCLHHATKIQTDVGVKTIGEIVEKRQQVNVLSLNLKTNQLEFKPILNWFNNGESPVTDWIELKLEHGPFIKCTANHKIYTQRGWISAEELNEDLDMLCVDSCRINSLLCGTLLGDSILRIEPISQSYRLSFSHTNKEYFDFKVTLLGLDGRSTVGVSGFGSKRFDFYSKALTKSSIPIELFYDFDRHSMSRGKRIEITLDTLKKLLTPSALSLWIADDGSLRFNNGDNTTPVLSIAVMRYSDSQVLIFKEYFQKVWYSKPTLQPHKRDGEIIGYSLNFNTKDTLYILNKLRTLQCKGTEYKFYFPTEGYINPIQKQEFSKFKKNRIRHVNKESFTKYDIEVKDNNNYFANGILVHNCRVLAFVENDTVTYLSRKGKTYETFSHWDDDLKNLFPSGTILDGEAFNPNLGFQEIVRRVKRVKTSRLNIEDDPLQYWIYDVVLPIIRYDARLEFLEKREDTDHIKIVPTYLLESEVQLKRYHQRNLIDGYEGTMIRSRHGLYKPDRRSYDLLKYKDFLDEEFEIIGGRSAQGRDEGTVVFECATSSGQSFNVRPKGTWDERKNYLDNLDAYIGQMLTVRFQEKSEDGVPIFPVGLSVRDFE